MKRASVAREEWRMANMLARALAVTLAAPAAVLGAEACTGDDASTADGGLDASPVDASIDGANLADADPIVDAGACAPVLVQIDAATDGGIECGVFQRFPCGAPSGLPVYADCFFKLDDCPSVCPGSLFFNCHYYSPNCDGGVVDDGGNGDAGDTIVECSSCVNGVGRRPANLVPQPRARAPVSPIGEHFAAAAHLEAASIHAFRILARELAALGAPPDLVRGAERARRDEIRHARATARIAKIHGGTPARARVTKHRARSLEDIALENAVEGSVRETFGALVAMWQAGHARDERIASLMRELAVDEARHAALASSVATWAESKLDAAAVARVRAAKERAVRELERDVQREPEPALASVAGLPSTATRRAMLAALFARGSRLGSDSFGPTGP